MSEMYHRGTGGWDGPSIDSDGNHLIREDESNTGQKILIKSKPYRRFVVTLDDGRVINDETDTETVTVYVVDGLEVARGTDPREAAVLDYDGDVTLTIDGVETTKTLSNGTVSFDVTTDKPAGSTIKVEADSLTDHPSESDSVEIEVVSQ